MEWSLSGVSRMREDYTFKLRCGDKDCEYYGKELVWIPVNVKYDRYKLQCPSEILTQTKYNLKFVDFKSEAQMEEEEDEA